MKADTSTFNKLLRPLGIPILGEGVMMLACLIPALHYNDGTALQILPAGLFTLMLGIYILAFVPKGQQLDRKMSYLFVTLLWLVMGLFGTLPFLVTGSITHFANAFFESMSGFTSTGATIFAYIEVLPPSILLWRSLSQWVGGFGIMLLVLAVVPSLGINKYSLYTAEASSADNTGKETYSMTQTVRRTLSIYLTLTFAFVFWLYADGMSIWEAVNLTFTNISSGGFSIHSDGLASVTHSQQYILALAMLFSGINFTLIYHFFTFRFGKIRHKLDQFGFYITLCAVSIAAVAVMLRFSMGYAWNDSIRYSTVQTLSVITTTGSLVADTSQWWMPITFLFVALSLCGGMAGSTTGGLKAMRVIILLRNVRNMLINRLHPHAVNPVRLNGKPVSAQMSTNVMVIFFVFLFTIGVGCAILMLCGINATESLGAVVACISGYGPGLGSSAGFGNYAGFTVGAKWVLSILMLMGRLECITVYILFVGRYRR